MNLKSLLIAAFCASAPVNVTAQELTISVENIKHCLEANLDQASCIGAASARCIEVADGGGAVDGVCYAAELAFWDDLLNNTYRDLIVEVQAFDVGAKETGYVPPIAESQLRAMQQAWIPYRDTRCSVIGLSYNGGTAARGGGTECQMRETAEQALVLQDMFARFHKSGQ